MRLQKKPDYIHDTPRFAADSKPSPKACTYADAHGSEDFRNSCGVSTVTSFPASINAILFLAAAPPADRE